MSRSKASASGAVEAASSPGGTATRATQTTKHVEQRRQRQGQEDRARQRPLWIVQLFRDIDDGLEADEGEHRQQRCTDEAKYGSRVGVQRTYGRNHLGKARDQVRPQEGTGGDHHDEPADLDQGHCAGKSHGLLDAPGGNGAHAQHHGGDDDRLGQINEYGDVAGAADADGGGRHHGDRDHQETHRGGPAIRSEGLADIGGLAGGDRHAPAELGEGGSREPHEHGRGNECQRRLHARARGRRTDQHIDAGADRDAHAVQNRVGEREGAPEADRVGFAGNCLLVGLACHWRAPLPCEVPARITRIGARLAPIGHVAVGL